MKLLQRMKSKKGFTLVEMVLVIAILAVILAFAVPGVDSYVKRIKLMELDDSARSIFMAAQNKLMTLRSSGKSLNFEGAELVPIENVPDFFKEGEYSDNEKTRPKFTYIKSDDLKKIPEGDSNIISLGAIEDQIYTNEFVIEYDATTGTVFGVFYTEDDGALSGYAPENMERDFEKRLEDGGTIGYYGGGTLVEVPVGEEITTPIIKNGAMEKLVVYVEWPDGFDEAEKLYFTLSIVGPEKGAASNMQTVEIISKDDSCYITKDNYSTIILDSLAPGLGSDNGQWDIPSDAGDHNLSYPFVLERDFKGWVLKKNLVFDSERGVYYPKYKGKMWQGAEMEGTEWLRDDYPMDPQDNGSSSEGQGYPGSNTNSNYIINPGSDITVYVTFYDKSGVYKDIPTVKPYPVNSYFNALDGTTAKIAAGRHLQNLSNYVLQDTVSDVFIEHDIDFSKSPDSDTDPEKKNVYYYWNADETYNRYYDFKPIGSQFVKNATFLKNFDGNGCTISYLKIDSDAHHFPENSSGYENTAFITDLLDSGRMSNITFYRPWIIGKTINTAVFVGKAAAGTNFHNITIINPIVEGGVEGVESYVGTLCADYNCNGGIEKCNVVITDYSNDYDFSYEKVVVEGETLKEYVNESGKHYQDSLDWGDPTNDPYKKFYIKGLTATTYAGGLLGRSSGTLNGPFCSVRVESEGVAGGLVGLVIGGNVQKVYVGGHTYNGSYIGETESGDDYCLININGKKGSGGIVGELTNGGFTGGYSTASVRYVADKSDGYIGINPKNAGGGNTAYALGWVIDADSNKVVSKSSKYVADIRNVNNAVTSQAEPYDISLGEVYPYHNDDTYPVHIGDWPVDPPLFGIFYWEKVGEEYFIKSVGYNAKEDEKVDFGELKDGVTVETFGYGYYFTNAAYKTDPNVMSDVGQSYGSVPAKIIESIENATNTQPTVVMRQWAQDGVHDLKEIIFDYNYNNSNVGSKAFFFNPDFCGVSMTDNLGKRSENEPYHIRNAQQLKNINNSLGSNFVQDLDIDASGETWRPLGSFTDYFSGKYNGNDKNLTIGKLDTKKSDSGYGNGYGLFGVTRDATIERVKVDYPVDSPTAELNEYSARNGLGGIVGVAVGGTISECTVKNFNVSATKCPEIAIGGIVGFSSANITNCYVNGNGTTYGGTSAVSIDNSSTNMNTVSAAGGIAGSASGTISGCKVYSFDMGDGKLLTDEIKSDGTFNGTLIIAGGIVGNNVSFEGKTELTVDKCTSEASLTRESYVLGSHPYGVLIHPIAPDNFKLDLKNLDLYFDTYFSSGKEMDEEGKIKIYKATLYSLNIIPNETDELPIYYFVTGTGVSDVEAEHAYNSSSFAMHVTTTITNCTAAQGRYFYNSRICGLSNGVNMEAKGLEPTPTDDLSQITDVYVFIPPNISVSYVEYTKLSPTVGVFSLFEKEGKTVIATAEKIDRGGSKDITSKPEGQIDPLDRYGIVTTLGRLSDLTVTVDGKTVALATGKAYLGEDGKSIGLGEISDDEIVKYYEFSEILLGDGLKEGSHTIVATYKNDDGSTTTYTANIRVPKRYPYAGAYRVWNHPSNYVVATGVYNDAEHMGDKARKIENNTDGLTDAYKYGIILEHSSLAPHTLNELSIKILYAEQGVEKTIPVYESDLNPSTSPTIGANVYGKSFDAYAVDDSVIAKMPENQDFAIEVSADGTLLAKLDGLKTKINIPYIGAYGVQEVKFTYETYVQNRLYIHYLAQFGNDKDIRDVNGEFTYVDSGAVKQEILETTSYGVILERGYDIKKVNVKLAGGVEEAEIAGDKLVACGEIYYRADNGAQYNDPKVNNVSVSLYTIPFEMIPENTDTITVEYDGYEVYSLSVDVVDDLCCSVKPHVHKLSEWKNDEDNHWKVCTDSHCPNKDEQLELAGHEFGEWYVSVAPTETEKGEMARECSVCGKKQTKEIDPHTHQLSDWITDNENHWKVCEDPDCPYSEGTKFDLSRHTLECKKSDDVNHTYTCKECTYSRGEQHIWEQSGGTDTTITYKCAKCEATKEEPKLSLDYIKYVGIYVKSRPDQWTTSYSAWYFDSGVNPIVDNNFDESKLYGEAGILINKAFVDKITVYVDDVKVEGSLHEDSEANSLTYRYSNISLSLTPYKIPPELFAGKYTATIKIEYDGKTLIERKVDVISKPTNLGIYRVYYSEGNYFAYGKRIDKQEMGIKSYGNSAEPTKTYGIFINVSNPAVLKSLEIRAGGGTISLSERNKYSITNAWNFANYELIEFSQEIPEGTDIEICFNGETLMTLNSNDI